MSKIRILNGPYRSREKTLADKALTIGRDAEAGIQILDRSASRFHAEVFPVGGMWFVRDLDSKNGTFVNDEQVEDEELLREGDVIKIGSTELRYESGTSLQDDESSSRISFQEDADILGKTLEFRLDELSDISEPKDESEAAEVGARSLRMLYQIGRLLGDAGEQNLNEREVQVLEYLVQHLPAECAVIFRRDGATGKLVPAGVRTSGQLVQPVISRSIVKKTFAENKALHIANAQEDTRFERNASVAQKGVRSVLCVPLVEGGTVRGVVYLGRGERADPFAPLDLELISAVAIQIGLCHHADEQRRRHRIALVRTVTALIRALESRDGINGAGERLARFCVAMAGSLHLDASARDRLARAGLVYPVHRAALGRGEDQRLDVLLERADEFENVVPILRAADLLGEDTDTEAQVLAVAHAFQARMLSNPGADVAAVIDELKGLSTLDEAVVAALHACHLDGTLYNAVLE